MSPFKEATYDQLRRLLVIIDRKQFSCDMLLKWASEGDQIQPEFSTEETIRYWENRA
jgi:hypothetical protein